MLRYFVNCFIPHMEYLKQAKTVFCSENVWIYERMNRLSKWEKLTGNSREVAPVELISGEVIQKWQWLRSGLRQVSFINTKIIATLAAVVHTKWICPCHLSDREQPVTNNLNRSFYQWYRRATIRLRFPLNWNIYDSYMSTGIAVMHSLLFGGLIGSSKGWGAGNLDLSPGTLSAAKQIVK
jgi:hypothetical protein